jgi:3,4-dihydroxy 2-butanone 4-phosphate synthase/GTP cyclohydrolase II
LNGAYLTPELSARVDRLRERALIYASERGLPFVTVSYAQSLDGSIAASSGHPLALSGRTSLTLTHALRSAHDAILVGIGTILADDPRLTVRMVAGPDPQPVVLDSHLRFPQTARLLDHPRGAWIATTAPVSASAASLPPQARILRVVADRHGQVSLVDLLRALAEQGIRSIMVEGGRQVLSSFVQQQLANFAVVTIAPRFVGGLSAMTLPPANGKRQPQPRLSNVEYAPAGEDLTVWGDVEWTP